MSGRLRRVTAALVLTTTAALVGCSSSGTHTAARPVAPSPTPAPSVTTVPTVAVNQDPSQFYQPPPNLTPGPPGSLVRAEMVTGVFGVPAGATVWRILYRSRSIYQDDIPVTGYVVVPPGPAPPGGWKVLSWAHGTTGITTACAPSMFNTGGPNRPYLVPELVAFLSAGFAIAATDYEGLGGLQPYLLGESEGRDVLDAARAAHNLPGVRLDRTTVIFGHSQGGHAALFAGELAPTYAPDLHVIGVVAAAPATNLSLILSLAASQTGQAALSFTVDTAWSWVKTYRDLPAATLFTPEGIQLAPTLTSGCLADTFAAIANRHLQSAALFQPDVASNPVVLAHARLNDPGRARTTAPILVLQGTADDTVPPALTDLYVGKMACPVGDTVDYLHVTGASHLTIPTAVAGDLLSWTADRVAGRTAPSTCSAPGSVRTVTTAP